MRGQGFGGGVFAGEFGFREYGVDLLVAGSTEENDGVTFGPAEVPAGAGSFVEGSWDKMVPGEARRGTSTKGAASIFHHPNLPDRRQWWQQFSGPAQDGLACIVIARRLWQFNLSRSVGFLLPAPCKAETPRSERNPGLQEPCKHEQTSDYL